MDANPIVLEKKIAQADDENGTSPQAPPPGNVRDFLVDSHVP